MLGAFWSLLKGPVDWDVITRVGSGIVVVIGGVWAVAKYYSGERRKDTLDIESKEDERRTRLALLRKDDEAVKFEYIRLSSDNFEWREIGHSEYHEWRRKRVNKAQHILGNFDLSELRYFALQEGAILENTCPSFEIVVVNIARQTVSLLEVGARIVYMAHVDNDMVYGGAPESAYEIPLKETFFVDVSSLMGKHGAYLTECLAADSQKSLYVATGLDAPHLSEFDVEFGIRTCAEWKCDTVLRSDKFTPYVINPDGRFRFKVVFKRWPIWMSAIVQITITTPSGEKFSKPLYIRYGNVWLQ